MYTFFPSSWLLSPGFTNTGASSPVKYQAINSSQDKLTLGAPKNQSLSTPQAQVYFGKDTKKIPCLQLTPRFALELAQIQLASGNVQEEAIPPLAQVQRIDAQEWEEYFGENNPLQTLAREGKMGTIKTAKGKVKSYILDTRQLPGAKGSDEKASSDIKVIETAWKQYHIAQRLRKGDFSILIDPTTVQDIVTPPKPKRLSIPEASAIAKALIEAGAVHENAFQSPWYQRISFREWEQWLGPDNPLPEITKRRNISPALAGGRDGRPIKYYLDPAWFIDVEGPDGKPVPWRRKPFNLDTFEDLRGLQDKETPFDGKTKIVSDADKKAIEEAYLQLQLTKLLMAGKQLPLKEQYYVGYIGSHPNFSAESTGQIGVKSPQATFQEWLDQLTKEIQLPETGSPVILKMSNPEEVKALLEDKVIPLLQFDGEIAVPQKNGKIKKQPIHETLAYPVLLSLMCGRPLSPAVKPILDAIDKMDIFQIQVPGDRQLTRDLQEKLQPLKRQMVGIELAKMQYFERLDIKEVVTSLSMGMAIGSGGELLVHTLLHEGGFWAIIARMGVLGLVDLVDNILGEFGAFRSDLDANGIELSKEALFGTNDWWKILRQQFELAGEAGIFAKRAISSAAKGATTGIAISPITSSAVSAEDLSIFIRSVGAGIGAWGTALSIPFNIRATLPQLQATALYLMKTGIIDIPDTILPESERGKNLSPKEKLSAADPDKLRVYATVLSMQEMMARVGFSASMRAFVRVPLAGTLLLSQAVGVPPEVAAMLFMGGAPGAENLLRLIITNRMLNKQKPADVESMRRLLWLAHKGKITTEMLHEQLGALLSQGKDQKVGKLLTADVLRKSNFALAGGEPLQLNVGL